MRNLSPSAVASFWSELEKIAKDDKPSLTDRAMLALPGVGALAGGTLGYLDPTAGPGVKGKLISAALGAGTGATLGWLPSVARDLKDAIMPQKVAMLNQVTRRMTLRPVAPSSNAIKVPSSVAAKSSTATNLTELKSAF